MKFIYMHKHWAADELKIARDATHAAMLSYQQEARRKQRGSVLHRPPRPLSGPVATFTVPLRTQSHGALAQTQGRKRLTGMLRSFSV